MPASCGSYRRAPIDRGRRRRPRSSAAPPRIERRRAPRRPRTASGARRGESANDHARRAHGATRRDAGRSRPRCPRRRLLAEGGLVRRLAVAGARAVGLDPSPVALDAGASRRSRPARRRTIARAALRRHSRSGRRQLRCRRSSVESRPGHVPAESMDAALAEAARVLRRAWRSAMCSEPLARGPARFELLRAGRRRDPGAAARPSEALSRALQGRFAQLASRDAVLTVRHADFEALRARTISVDPARAAAFDEQESALRAAFERLGRPVEGGGYELDQPFRISLLGL